MQVPTRKQWDQFGEVVSDVLTRSHYTEPRLDPDDDKSYEMRLAQCTPEERESFDYVESYLHATPKAKWELPMSKVVKEMPLSGITGMTIFASARVRGVDYTEEIAVTSKDLQGRIGNIEELVSELAWEWRKKLAAELSLDIDDRRKMNINYRLYTDTEVSL